MATYNEHIYAVKNILSGGPASDDSRYSNRLIGHMLKQARATLIKRKLSRYHFISDFNKQTICVPLELHTYHDCSCIPDRFGCNVLRSTCKFPKDIVGRVKGSLQVKYADGRVIPQTTVTENNYSKHSLTETEPQEGWFIEAGRLYILNSDKLKYVLGTAYWEDPEEVYEFCTCSGDMTDDNPCYDVMEDEFPIDSELVIPMYQIVLELLQVQLQVPQDRENDSSDVQVRNG